MFLQASFTAMVQEKSGGQATTVFFLEFSFLSERTKLLKRTKKFKRDEMV